MQLSGASGTIFSPDYPYPYPSDSKCIWVISVPSGKIVKLTFQDYDLGTRFTHCRDVSEEEDFVEIRDGKDSSSKELVFYCGYHTLENLVDLYSTGNHMRVTFSSTSFALGTKKGFKARYEVSEPCKYWVDQPEFCFDLIRHILLYFTIWFQARDFYRRTATWIPFFQYWTRVKPELSITYRNWEQINWMF